jgi:integrase
MALVQSSGTTSYCTFCRHWANTSFSRSTRPTSTSSTCPLRARYRLAPPATFTASSMPAWDAAVRTRKLAISPMDSTTKAPSPGESDHGTALDDDQLRTLIGGFKGSSLFGIVSTAAFTGARRNEILALRWSDLDSLYRSGPSKAWIKGQESRGAGSYTR